LALPTQKIVAMAGLVDELVTSLGEQHPDFMTLKEFSTKINPLVTQSITLKRVHDTRSKVFFIEANVQGLKGIVRHLVPSNAPTAANP